MALYIYETTDSRKPVQRFELHQSMKDEPYTHHPETGLAIKRVITGGFYMARGHAPTHADMRDSHGHSAGEG